MSRVSHALLEVIIDTPSAGTVTGAGVTQAVAEVVVLWSAPVHAAAALVEVLVADDGTSSAGDGPPVHPRATYVPGF